MPQKLKILFLSAEVAPLAKVGGLGDVAGALPKALKKMGADIRICLPFYGFILAKDFKIKKIISEIKVPIGRGVKKISLWEANLPESNVVVYLVKHPYFNAKKIYSGGRLVKGKKYTRGENDIERFAFFTRAALEASRALNFQPDIIHAQDWHMALTSDFLKKLKNENDDFFANTKTLFTIHNLANQGIADPEILNFTGLNLELTKEKNIDFMARGIIASDLINTVSSYYAKEILTTQYGAGLEKFLLKRKADLYGIINGIDTNFFNPARDKFIKHKYSLKSLKNKTKDKLFLQKKLGLTQDENIPVVGLVSRLVWQKGLELFNEDFLKLPAQFIFLGTGEEKYEDKLKKYAEKHPEKFSAQIVFDVKLAQEVYAGSDIFLMPSRFEPCGLGQLIAMRYGTVPIAHKTGGLSDTIINYGIFNKKANGFLFKKFKSRAFYNALNKALKIYAKKPKTWLKLQENGMKEDFSWKKSAQKYLRLYKKLADKK